jgi:hypothetical protein
MNLYGLLPNRLYTGLWGAQVPPGRKGSNPDFEPYEPKDGSVAVTDPEAP